MGGEMRGHGCTDQRGSIQAALVMDCSVLTMAAPAHCPGAIDSADIDLNGHEFQLDA